MWKKTKMMYFWDTGGVKCIPHSRTFISFLCEHWKKHQHYLGFHVSNATFDMAEHSWTARNGTGSDEGEKASETVMWAYVWSSRQILRCKNVGWRRLRSLPSSLMNGVHFNYTNAAPYVVHYWKEREIKTGTRGLWQQRKGLKTTRKMEFKGGGTREKHVNMKCEAAEETVLRQDQIKKKNMNVIELRPSFSVTFAIKKRHS